MTTLVVGATGATGRLLVEQLLERGHNVKVIVRSPDKLPDVVRTHERLCVIPGSILDVHEAELARHTNGCAAVASCLGHVLSLKGIYGQPRRLVTAATRRLCDAITANRPEQPARFVLMNTAGNSNRDLHEEISLSQRLAMDFIRFALPPQVDNEAASDYLRTAIGQNHEKIEWVVVRPDTLINEGAVTEYRAYPSPTRSALFDPGKTSRINVAHFMAELINDDKTWNRWKGQMPVIYNTVPS